MPIPATAIHSIAEITHWLSKNRIVSSVVPLAGDGSTRTFYRAHFDGGGKPLDSRIPSAPATRIVLSDPQWTLSQDYAPHQAYLKSHSIPVPEFYEVDPKNGLLLMQDLGDVLLQEEVMRASSRKMEWLERAARLLGQLHGKTFPVPKHLPVCSRRFDSQKYFDELSFTFEHLVAGFLGQEKMTVEQQSELKAFTDKIAAVGPDVFCHRDYHCRNILVEEGNLFLIDFQDARLGSPQYDLASLVFDPYVPLSDSERSRLVGTYRDVLTTFPLYEQIDWKQFHNGLVWIGIQRTIKAAGSFASFYTRNKKTTHLKYIVPALETAQKLLQAAQGLPPGLGGILNVPLWLRLAREKEER